MKHYYAFTLDRSKIVRMLFKGRHNAESERKRVIADGDNIVVDDNGSVHHNIDVSKPFLDEEEYNEMMCIW